MAGYGVRERHVAWRELRQEFTGVGNRLDWGGGGVGDREGKGTTKSLPVQFLGGGPLADREPGSEEQVREGETMGSQHRSLSPSITI